MELTDKQKQAHQNFESTITSWINTTIQNYRFQLAEQIYKFIEIHENGYSETELKNCQNLVKEGLIKNIETDENKSVFISMITKLLWDGYIEDSIKQLTDTAYQLKKVGSIPNKNV